MSRMEKFAADCDSVMVPYDPELLLYSVTRDMEYPMRQKPYTYHFVDDA